jgi:hypothetical protein
MERAAETQRAGKASRYRSCALAHDHDAAYGVHLNPRKSAAGLQA